MVRRLFSERLGATPNEVHGTRRLLFAKQLLSETDLPITDVAMAAGFGSLRRFNTTFREAYRMAPRDLRKDTPYLAYAELDFEVPVGIKGDNYDRYFVRMREMDESVHMIRQLVDILAEVKGPINVDDRRCSFPEKEHVYTEIESLINHFKLVMDGPQVPPGEVYSAHEGANGELGFFLVSDGTDQRPLPVKWNAFSVTGGVGWDFPLAPHWTLRPMLNFTYGYVTSDLNIAKWWLENNTNVDLEFLDKGKLKARGLGGSGWASSLHRRRAALLDLPRPSRHRELRPHDHHRQ